MSLPHSFGLASVVPLGLMVTCLTAITTDFHACAAAGGVQVVSNASEPGELILEMPTLKCLGVRWLIGRDGNGDAKVAVAFRRVGSPTWRSGLDLFRVETEAIRQANRPPAGQTMFAGSVFGLDENTEYEVKLSLHDSDGGSAERIVRMKTWAEPQLSFDAPKRDVYPGQLAAALSEAHAGQILRLHPGIYRGTFHPRNGMPGKPVGIVGVGDGEVVLDGQGANQVIDGPGLHNVIFEGVTFQNARWAIAVNGGHDLVVRHCVIRDVDHGFVATRNANAQQRILIADNVMIGRSTWPRTKGIEDRRAVQIAGTGNVVCHNRIHGFADAIDTFPAYPCSAIDFYGNEISECTDDGIEMDYSEHNTRCFENRLTNVFQGISLQPVHGGPVYVFRNAIYNVGMETFKIHNHPSGAILYHNTSVKAGMPLMLFTSDAVSNCVHRNNLFLGTEGNYAYETTARMENCDFDVDGFGGQWKLFLKWNGARYRTLADASKSSPVYRRALFVTPRRAFQSGVMPPDAVQTQFAIDVNDLRLAPGSEAVDAGVVLPGINDDYIGDAPDLGAYEANRPLPRYGPRSVRQNEMPRITRPVMFNTPEADAICSALEVFPPDNPWNQVIEDWPLHPDSDAIITSIGKDKPLRYNPDMGFILVPPDQKRVDVTLNGYPDESDPGPYPVPDNVPIEGWPAHFDRAFAAPPTLEQVQRSTDPGDRHAIIVDPVNRILYEFFVMRKTDQGWQAAQASIFYLKTNRLRPLGWTSADAAGLPIFPAVVRYDELQRGIVEHAMRVTVKKTRRGYVAPATHYASRHDNAEYPRMGERLRLRTDFDTSSFSPEVRAILKGLQKYGMFVADNGIDWAISVAPDPRIPVLHAEFRRIRGSAFEVVVAPR